MWFIQSAATENKLLYFARQYTQQPTPAVRQHSGASVAGVPLSQIDYMLMKIFPCSTLTAPRVVGRCSGCYSRKITFNYRYVICCFQCLSGQIQNALCQVSDFPLSILRAVTLYDVDFSQDYSTKIYVLTIKPTFMSTLIYKYCSQ